MGTMAIGQALFAANYAEQGSERQGKSDMKGSSVSIDNAMRPCQYIILFYMQVDNNTHLDRSVHKSERNSRAPAKLPSLGGVKPPSFAGPCYIFRRDSSGNVRGNLQKMQMQQNHSWRSHVPKYSITKTRNEKDSGSAGAFHHVQYIQCKKCWSAHCRPFLMRCNCERRGKSATRTPQPSPHFSPDKYPWGPYFT